MGATAAKEEQRGSPRGRSSVPPRWPPGQLPPPGSAQPSAGGQEGTTASGLVLGAHLAGRPQVRHPPEHPPVRFPSTTKHPAQGPGLAAARSSLRDIRRSSSFSKSLKLPEKSPHLRSCSSAAQPPAQPSPRSPTRRPRGASHSTETLRHPSESALASGRAAPRFPSARTPAPRCAFQGGRGARSYRALPHKPPRRAPGLAPDPLALP